MNNSNIFEDIFDEISTSNNTLTDNDENDFDNIFQLSEITLKDFPDFYEFHYDKNVFVPYENNDEIVEKNFYLNENTIKYLIKNFEFKNVEKFHDYSKDFQYWARENIKNVMEHSQRLELLDNDDKEDKKNSVENSCKSPDLFESSDNDEKEDKKNLLQNSCKSPDLFKNSEDDEDDDDKKNSFQTSCKSPDLFESSDEDDETDEKFFKIDLNEIILKIEEIIKKLLQKLISDGNMELLIPDTSKWSNVEMLNRTLTLSQTASQRKVSSSNWNSKFRFTIIMYLLAEIYELLLTGLTCTLRELYYRNPDLCQKQMNVNNALKDICAYLCVAPWQIGIFSSSKGCLAGSLTFILPNNDFIDCSLLTKTGIHLPLNITQSELIDSSAEFVLIVEKETIFHKLLHDNILIRMCKDIILITGKGYPDINTRIIINKIWNKFHIPIYALVDADPYGIEIMFTYRYGSKEMIYNSEYLACPQIQWIGVHPSEIDLLGIPSIKLTKDDQKKITNLLKRPYLQRNVRKELEIFMKTNKKAEIEGVSSFSLNFLLNDYIANKVKWNMFI